MAARRNLRISGRTSCVPLRRDRWSSSFGQAEREELNLQLSGEVYQVWRGISRHSIANFHPGGATSHSSGQILPTLQVIYHVSQLGLPDASCRDARLPLGPPCATFEKALELLVHYQGSLH
jgi:hypothetical protein